MEKYFSDITQYNLISCKFPGLYYSNYHDGFSTQWVVSRNNDIQIGGNGTKFIDSTQSGTIGGDEVRAGDHSKVIIDQFVNQRDDSP